MKRDETDEMFKCVISNLQHPQQNTFHSGESKTQPPRMTSMRLFFHCTSSQRRPPLRPRRRRRRGRSPAAAVGAAAPGVLGRPDPAGRQAVAPDEAAAVAVRVVQAQDAATPAGAAHEGVLLVGGAAQAVAEEVIT